MSDDSNGEWAGSESKDWKDGRHRRENSHVLAHAGEIRGDRRARQYATTLNGAYERAAQRGWLTGGGWPSTVEETLTYRMMMDYHGTEGFGDALEAGDAAGVRHYVGSQEDTPDLSGMRTLQAIKDLITGDASMLYIFGHMGNGKSFFASLIAEIWADETPGGIVGGNTRTIEAADWLGTWDELKDWMHEDQQTVLAGEATPKLFIFDEGSSKASGTGKDGYDAKTKLATMCYKIRKHGGNLIVIGHDGKDIHPAVREMCTVAHKTDKKTAQFFREVRNRKGHDPLTPPLEGIPLPDKQWQPNTYDTADWSWGDSDAEDGGVSAEDAYDDMAVWTVVQCMSEGLSARETAKFVPFGKSKCNTLWNEYEDGGAARDIADSVTGVIA